LISYNIVVLWIITYLVAKFSVDERRLKTSVSRKRRKHVEDLIVDDTVILKLR
jgi:hypothetical protein